MVCKMKTRFNFSKTCLLAIVVLCGSQSVWAHGKVGKRLFLEPLTAADANVKNELDLPRFEFLSQPGGWAQTLSYSFEKELYPGRISFVLGQDHVRQPGAGGMNLSGWDNLDAGMKWEAYKNAAHEFAFSPALFVTLPTGNSRITTRQTVWQPMLLFAKGMGDLHRGWLRPLALQGDVGYARSSSGPRTRQAIYDLVLEYSLPYLNQWVRHANAGYRTDDTLRTGWRPGAILGDLLPFVEINSTQAIEHTPGGKTTFVRPGVAYMGSYFQISAAWERVVSGPPGIIGRSGGVILGDLFLDDIVPALRWTPWGQSPE